VTSRIDVKQTKPVLAMKRAQEPTDDAAIGIGVAAARQRLAQRLDEWGR
jgi:hypothetical protein